jgi:hypothetical protein
MNNIDKHLENISEIRSLMERSSKFLSLSGLSGISAGIVAIVGAIIINLYLNKNNIQLNYSNYEYSKNFGIIIFFILNSVIMLIFAIGFSILFSTRMAKRKNLPIWNNTTKYLLTNLFIPLIAGGLFCLILLYNGELHLLAPSTLIFYGLALLNASKFTVNEIKYLGLVEIFLGLVALLFVSKSLIFWASGFGVTHIIYGTLIYLKYEK